MSDDRCHRRRRYFWDIPGANVCALCKRRVGAHSDEPCSQFEAWPGGLGCMKCNVIQRDHLQSPSEAVQLREVLVKFARGLVSEQWYTSPSYERSSRDDINEAKADTKADIGRARGGNMTLRVVVAVDVEVFLSELTALPRRWCTLSCGHRTTTAAGGQRETESCPVLGCKAKGSR